MHTVLHAVVHAPAGSGRTSPPTQNTRTTISGFKVPAMATVLPFQPPWMALPPPTYSATWSQCAPPFQPPVYR